MVHQCFCLTGKPRKYAHIDFHFKTLLVKDVVYLKFCVAGKKETENCRTAPRETYDTRHQLCHLAYWSER